MTFPIVMGVELGQGGHIRLQSTRISISGGEGAGSGWRAEKHITLRVAVHDDRSEAINGSDVSYGTARKACRRKTFERRI
jgi:hypothetical protein